MDSGDYKTNGRVENPARIWREVLAAWLCEKWKPGRQWIVRESTRTRNDNWTRDGAPRGVGGTGEGQGVYPPFFHCVLEGGGNPGSGTRRDWEVAQGG